LYAFHTPSRRLKRAKPSETLESGDRLRYGVPVLPSPVTVSLDPALAASLVVVVGIVAVSARAVRGEGRRTWRRAAGWVAALLLGAAWISPLQTIASHYLLTAHLLQISLVMGVIPPLLLLALPAQCRVALPRGLRRLGGGLVHPVCGMLAINVAFFGWHMTGAYDASLRNQELYALQQISLLAASVLFWWPIVVPLGGRRVLSGWTTLGYIFVATIPQTFGGITVALAKHSLYPTYGQAPRLFGLGVLTDQQIAGACIALVSKIALFTAFSIIFLRLLNEAADDGGDDGGGGGRRRDSDRPSPQPSGSVPWLVDLNAGRTVPEPAPRRIPIRVPAGAGPRRE
jgi:cytochrome c oxidase assembly factor CtaG